MNYGKEAFGKKENLRPQGGRMSSNLVADRHILVAVDDTESSKRAVLYVADFLGEAPGFKVTLLSLVPVPEPDHFPSEKERREWIDGHHQGMETLLRRYRQILIEGGFPEDKVAVSVETTESLSIAEAIIETQERVGSCTVVVGRHGISKQEEFLFGSTSNKLLHMPKNCSLWIVE
ncbi:MAG: universal stress protein [bacterium]|nr:universal stress protein [bacterium]